MDTLQDFSISIIDLITIIEDNGMYFENGYKIEKLDNNSLLITNTNTQLQYTCDCLKLEAKNIINR